MPRVKPVFNKKRAQKYSRLQWATEIGYLDKFISFSDLQTSDTVIDLGTGTGLVASHVAPKVHKVIGLDTSREMLKVACTQYPGLSFMFGDARELPFPGETFDRVLARMVFHHITEGIEKTAAEIFRVLKPGGTLVVSEGVPPNRQVKEEYEAIFRLKEKRLTFFEEDLVQLLEDSGFKDIHLTEHIIKKVSVYNWLANSGCSREVREKIMNMHLEASQLFKKAYHMEIKPGDCLIDMKFALAKGIKPIKPMEEVDRQ